MSALLKLEALPPNSALALCFSRIGVTNSGSEGESGFIRLRGGGGLSGEAGESIETETASPDFGADLMEELLSGGPGTLGSGGPFGWRQ